MGDPQLESIEKKLDVLIRLLGSLVIVNKSQGEQISILNKAKFQPKEIAEIIGTSRNAVSVYLSKKKRGKK
jgi:hypothetical protein